MTSTAPTAHAPAAGVAPGRLDLAGIHHVGLDHLSLLVGAAADLEAWASHLATGGVTSSGVYRPDGVPASFLTFRDPDGIQLELVAMDGA